MAEQLDLTTPVPTTVTTYFIQTFITAGGEADADHHRGRHRLAGRAVTFTYTGAEAKTRLSQLNTRT